ncbi:MAG: outer membrane protein assembly factor BamE [Alphaproteobacteria bacterium]|nr:outer membrane protein assembly factor BamE [Alphaproteobacteria bacterium]
MSDTWVNPLRWLVVLFLIAALSACATRVSNHGNKPDPDKLAQIEPGVQSKAQVKNMLGSPSSVGAFEKNTWYYISQVGERSWFFPEEATEREVVMIRFDDVGQVASIEQLDLEDGQEVDIVDRETPTQGQQLTFLQQMWQALIGGPGLFSGGSAGESPL